MNIKQIEVSYHRTVNLGNYNNAHLGGKVIADVVETDTEIYSELQEKLTLAVDKIADRIAAEAKLSK